MTTSLLLAGLTTAVLVCVGGMFFGLLSDQRSRQARSWCLAAVGLAVGIAVCGAWSGTPVVRVICPFVIVVGCQPLLQYRRRSTTDQAVSPVQSLP